MNNAGIGRVGEVIIIHNVTRYCDDIYECVASNGVPPTVTRQMRVTVECEFNCCPVQVLSCALCLHHVFLSEQIKMMMMMMMMN